MKTDINGVSQCQKGTENYETFYTTIRRKSIGLMCRIESRHDQYYKYCKVITEGEQ